MTIRLTQGDIMLPTLFISHGSPDLILRDNQVSRFLRSLGSKIKRPKSIIIVSAHWGSRELEILANPEPELIYDFYGFPSTLYAQQYPASNDLELVAQITQALEKKGISITQNRTREGYDHGVWSPLAMIYPDASIPIVQISLPLHSTPEELIQIGEVLREFRAKSMIIASGNVTHNLGGVNWHANNEVKEYAKSFRDWLIEKLAKGDIDALKNITKAPNFAKNHPATEHIMPIFINLGASKNHRCESMLESYMFGNLAMDTIVFKE
jgi:4,5-DOPA dioxygenase extradiol